MYIVDLGSLSYSSLISYIKDMFRLYNETNVLVDFSLLRYLYTQGELGEHRYHVEQNGVEMSVQR